MEREAVQETERVPVLLKEIPQLGGDNAPGFNKNNIRLKRN